MKADDRDTDHKILVYENYSAAESIADHLSNDKKESTTCRNFVIFQLSVSYINR